VALPTEWRRKPEEAAAGGKEINSLIHLTKTETVDIILAGLICPKATEAVHSFVLFVP
jgi:hypothetical protein